MIKEVIKDKLYISDDGVVYNDADGKNECKICYIKCGGKQRRGVVYLQIDGKQKNFYVNRLVAEYFIENPENKPIVRYINGDTKNNSASNLEWVTRKELVSIMQEDGRYFTSRKTLLCSICGELTTKKDGVCQICSKELTKEENEHLRKARIRDSLGKIDFNELNENEKETINLRLQYYTYEEIAKIKGITRQRVEQQIANAIKKTTLGKALEKAAKRESRIIVKIMQEINYKKAQLENMKIKAKVLGKEIEELENAIGTLDNIKSV